MDATDKKREFENQNTETLNKELKKTKRVMQILTVCLVVMLLGFGLVGISNGENKDFVTYAAIMFPTAFGVMMLDKKYKKIKTELELRN